jgi:hypothetical protein
MSDDMNRLDRALDDNEKLRAEVERLRKIIASPPLPHFTVAIYLVDRAYGGPEEGGWWYETGKRIDGPCDGIDKPPLPEHAWSQTFYGPDAELRAMEFVIELNAHLDSTANVGRREISSVLSTGRYEAREYEGDAPAFFPATRPHYE